MKIRLAIEKDVEKVSNLLSRVSELHADIRPVYVAVDDEGLGCYEVTLNVWEGNTNARKFYEKMGLRPKETRMEYVL